MRASVVLLAMVSLLLLGCVSSPVKSITDARFDYTISTDESSIIITFTKMPDVNAWISDAEVYKIIDKEAGESEWLYSCPSGEHIEKGKQIHFSCLPKEKGAYLFRFTIKHNEGASYMPREGEACLKYSDGHWECEIRGTAEFNVK